MKLSIIVPVYNCKYYLPLCIESLLRQTEDDFELILIVNGENTDNSIDICQKYGRNDKRIRTIVTKRKGAANARNIGLDEATGKYIGFVDSDDWIEPDMYERMINVLENEESDMAVCRYYEDYVGDVEKSGSSRMKGFSYEKLDSPLSVNDTMRLVASGRLENFLWNKLFRKELFLGIRLPERAIFEDASVIYQLVHKSKHVSFVEKPLYHYCKHSDSLTGHNDITSRLDSFDFFDTFYDFIKTEYSETAQYCGLFLYGLCVTMAYTYLKSNNREKKTGKQNIKKHFEYYKQEKSILNFPLEFSQKIAMRGFMTVSIPGNVFGLSIEYIRRQVFKKER